MTPQELKLSIIHLAMRGKLVDQCPADEPAQILLSRISAEKKGKGIKANSKVLPILDEDIPFDIPETWCWTRFGNIVSYNMGKTPPRAESQWWGNDFPWVAIADMPENGHIVTTKERVSFSSLADKFGNKVSKAGTMIMSFKLTVGRVSILDIDAVHNEAIISIYPFCDEDRIIQSYLFSILPTITQYGDSKNAIKGKTLNDTSISNLLIPLPPLAEQKRIVAKIEELLPLIERYEKAWSRLEDFNKRFPVDMQKSILQMAIKGKLVEQRPEEGTGEELYRQIQAEKQAFIKAGKIKKEKPLPEITEDEIPFEIPESWKWVRLCTIGNTQTGNTPSKAHPEYLGSVIPFITPGDILNGSICYSNQALSSLGKEVARVAESGTILQVCIGGSIGKAAVTNQEVTFNQQINSITPLNCIPDYVYSVMTSQSFIKKMKDSAGGTATPIINRGLWDSLLIPLPPLAEQKRIVARLEELLPLCERLK